MNHRSLAPRLVESLMPDPEAIKTAKSQAVRYLAYRDRSEKELTLHLGKKGHTPSVIEKAL